MRSACQQLLFEHALLHLPDQEQMAGRIFAAAMFLSTPQGMRKKVPASSCCSAYLQLCPPECLLPQAQRRSSWVSNIVAKNGLKVNAYVKVSEAARKGSASVLLTHTTVGCVVAQLLADLLVPTVMPIASRRAC
jgi:hypothetical protein